MAAFSTLATLGVAALSAGTSLYQATRRPRNRTPTLLEPPEAPSASDPEQRRTLEQAASRQRRARAGSVSLVAPANSRGGTLLTGPSGVATPPTQPPVLRRTLLGG